MTLMWGHKQYRNGGSSSFINRATSTPLLACVHVQCTGNEPRENRGNFFLFRHSFFFAVSTLRNVVGDENLMPATLQRRTRSDARMVLVLVTHRMGGPGSLLPILAPP